MQTGSHKGFHERIVFGWASSYSQQIHAGEPYAKLNPVFSIVITEFAVFPEEEGVHFVFELRETHHNNLVLTPHVQIHYIRLSDLLAGRLDVLETVNPELRHWLLFLIFGSTKEKSEMAHLVNHDPIVLRALDVYQRFTSDPAEREHARRRLLGELDYNLGMSASREEGILEGLKKGEAKGKAKGIREGVKESEAKWKIDSVLTILETKYQNTPQTIVQTLNAIKDASILDSLIVAATKCESLSEFEETLK